MKKKPLIICAFILILMSLVLASCQNKSLEEELEMKPDQVSVHWEAVTYQSIEENFNIQKEQISNQRGFYVFEDEKAIYVWINMGEQPTGGHNIEVLNVYSKDERLHIEVKETHPSSEDMVTQAFTYPYVVIKVNETNASIHVYSENDEWVQMNFLNEMPYIDGVLTGLIDQSSIEVQSGNDFYVFRSYSLGQLLMGIEDGLRIRVYYTEGDLGQLWAQEIYALE